MKIKSYQVGGVVYTPFGPSQQTTSSSTSDTKTEKITGTMKKEIIDVLKENGIPSDVDKFLSTANSFLNKSTSLSNMSLFGGTDDDYDLSDLIQIQKLANDVRWNKGLYDNAVKNLDAENAWGEVALDSRGYMYVANKDGNIETISAHEYYKDLDSGKYQAITNEQLMSLRERQGGMAFQSGVLSNLNKAIGMDTIYNQLRGVVEKLGTSTLQGYSSKEANDIFNGAKILMSSGPDGYYKITDEKQGRDVNKALNYLYQQLSPEMKRTLDANVAANGGNPNSLDKLEMIEMILLGHTNQKHAADFDSAATKSAGLDAESKVKKVEDTYLSRISAGQGEYVKLGLAPKGSVMDRGGLVVTAVDFGDVVDKQMDVLPQMSLADLRTKAEAFKATFGQDVTFGNQILKVGEEKGILWDGTSHLTGLYLPYTKDENGQIKPDLDLVERWDKMNKEIGNKKLTQTELSSLLQKHHIPATAIDFQTGQLKNTMLFLSFTGYASDGVIDLTESSKNWTEHLDRSETAGIKEIYDNVLDYGTTTPGRSTKKLDAGLGNSKRGKFYRGNVYIPIKSPYLGMHMSMNQRIPESIINNFAQRSSLTTEFNMANNKISGSFI